MRIEQIKSKLEELFSDELVVGFTDATDKLKIVLHLAQQQNIERRISISLAETRQAGCFTLYEDLDLTIQLEKQGRAWFVSYTDLVGNGERFEIPSRYIKII